MLAAQRLIGALPLVVFVACTTNGAGDTPSLNPSPTVAAADVERTCAGMTMAEVERRWGQMWGWDDHGEVHFFNEKGGPTDAHGRPTGVRYTSILLPTDPGETAKRARHLYVQAASGARRFDRQAKAVSCKVESSDWVRVDNIESRTLHQS